MVQVKVVFCAHQNAMNEELILFHKDSPNRKIISVSAVPHEPAGWFMTIAYEANV